MIRAVLGPTAAGKSEIALRLAKELGADLVSVDSMQAYRGMDIGTAKPSPAEQAAVAHHLIDIADPSEDLTVADFQRRGRRVIERSLAKGRPVVIAGGSGLHFRALVDPLEFPPSDPAVRAAVDAQPLSSLVDELVAADPDAGAKVDLANPRRVQRAVEIMRLGGGTPTERAGSEAAQAVRDYRARYPFRAVGIDPGPALEERVRRRFQAMLEDGILEEVARLRGGLGRNAAQAVGYKELIGVVEGDIDLATGVEAAIGATMALARRQRTFFRRDPRITWIEWHDDPAVRYQRARDVLEADHP